ncbi:DUF975 family protein [Exiguobacterium sp. SH0S7]|uniref:DUF975 family protein n=1 Tax=Exiguobacterium sp. SH0S7 TaxID=2510951 RepID=UPI00103FF9C5|nr:DUF975 family protein [Exiguobacterium sp. SH0S7]TCI70294.1 DUF975 family protein [Exiguobacterium sp. SH0S7]
MMQELKRRATEATRGKMLSLMMGSFLIAAFMEMQLWTDPYIQFSWLSFLPLLLIALTAPLSIGYKWIVLDVIRGQQIVWARLIDPFRENYLRHVLVTVLLGIYQLGWLLLFIIPGIVKYFSYAFTYFLLQDDPELSANEAITKSRDMMNGHKKEALYLIFPFFIVTTIGWIALIVVEVFNPLYWILTLGMPWLYPFIDRRFAVFYEETKREYDEQWNRSA